MLSFENSELMSPIVSKIRRFFIKETFFLLYNNRHIRLGGQNMIFD